MGGRGFVGGLGCCRGAGSQHRGCEQAWTAGMELAGSWQAARRKPARTREQMDGQAVGARCGWEHLKCTLLEQKAGLYQG